MICSPHSANSKWVNREIETFIEQGRTDKIIPFIVDGTAFSNDPARECFPQAIRDLPAEQEILGANINEMGRDAALVKVIAQMFGLRFDDLWQRHERQQKKKRNWIIAASTLAVLVMTGVAFWMYMQRQQTLKANWQMMENRSRFVSKTAIALVDDGDSYTARRILMEVLPEDLEHPDRPYTPEAENALRYACNKDNAVLKDNDKQVSFAMFSLDGKTIMSVLNLYEIVDYWDVYTGEKLQTITGRWNLFFNHECISRDRSSFLAYNYAGFGIYDLQTNELKTQINTRGTITASFSFDGKYVVSTNEDSTARVCDVATGNELKKLKWDQMLESAHFSPDGKYIAITPQYGSIIIWDQNTGEVSPLWGVYDYQNNWHTTSASFSPDGKHLIFAMFDKTIKIWNVEGPKWLWKEQYVLKGHTDGLYDYINSVSYSLDGKYVVSASSDGTVRVWDMMENNYLIWTYACYDGDNYYNFCATYPSCSPDGFIVIPASDSTLTILNANTKQRVQLMKNQNAYHSSPSFSPDGKYMAIAIDSTVSIMETQTGKEVKKIISDKDIINIRYNPNGEDLLYTTYIEQDTVEFYSIVMMDVETGTEIKSIDIKAYDDINAVNFSPDGKHIVIGTAYGTAFVGVYDTDTGQEVNRMEGHTYPITSVSYSHDGKYIVSASKDKTVKLWNASTGELIHTFIGHTDNIVSASFSPDDRYVISASWDGTARIWDVESGMEVYRMDGHEQGVCYATFSNDGRQIITASNEDVIKIWSFLPFQELVDQTRERFKKLPLTDEERRRYYLE